MQLALLFAALLLGSAPLCQGALTNLIANGAFAESQARPGSPDGWSCAGNPAVKQQLVVDRGRDGRSCAKLQCTEFGGDGPDFHAMLCQMGKVAVEQGRWYRLVFWARGEGIRGGAVELGLTDTRQWENAGLGEAFTPEKEWRQFDFLFRATRTLPASASRLQFWFKSAGTLWLADAALTESAGGEQWFPQIPTDGVKNFVPNSSFECGLANWGSFTYGLSGWAGNLYRLEGELDPAQAQHGRQSLRLSLAPGKQPVFYFDYYEPVRQPIRRVLAATKGWFRVTPGEPLTLSAWLKADVAGVTAQLVAIEAPNRQLRKPVTVGLDWQRQQFSFTPTQPFLFVALGLDLEASGRDAATLWLDAVQLERGTQATTYEPRLPVESFIESRGANPFGANIFTNSETDVALVVRAYNDTERAQQVEGKLDVTDFFDHEVWGGRPVLKVPPHAGAALDLDRLGRGQRGFFRGTWTSPASCPAGQSLRLAVIDPVTGDDSPFGFNHAYPWDFLVQSARQAGIVWWRDWSAKWQTIEPERGKWNFTAADLQIQRVLELNAQVEVLLPFPSTVWSTTALMDEVARAAGKNDYLRQRLPLGYAPKDLKDFGAYAAAVARHYQRVGPRAVTHFQILNEPLYTDYALPRRAGYTLTDYLQLLETASKAMRAAAPECRVVGGVSANLEAGLTRDFVIQGGLQWVDAFDLHLYDPPRPAESFEDSFADLERLMRAHGGPRPVWITEWGCYADDEPPCLPQSVGDQTMNRCRWPSERAATEHIVKFTAVAFAHGVRKIFFHAGTCGAINGPDAGGVLFAYGGAPRKMYAGVAALTELLGVPEECVRQLAEDGLRAYLFRAKNRTVAIAWCEPDKQRRLRLAEGVQAYDVMGNRLKESRPQLAQTPLYLVGPNAPQIIRAFQSVF